jgi:DNA-binding XRE family transcriptional regulator
VAGKRQIADPVALGDRIKKRRIELGLLQKEAAAFIGVNEENIYLWENGHCKPLVCFYPKIIDFLGYFPFIIDLSTFGGRIMQYRYMNGITPKAFGKLIGADPSTVRQWEAQRNEPNMRRKIQVESLIK